MNLFAEASEGSPFGWIIVMFILVMGTRQWCKWLKGNKVVGDAAKKGVISVLGRLFK